MSVHEDVTSKLYGGSSSKAPTKPNASSVGYIDQIPGW